MKLRPIIFSGEMVQAILEGRKTQTRRVITSLRGCKEISISMQVNNEPEQLLVPAMPVQAYLSSQFVNPERYIRYCPYGKPGDRLWVRETLCRGIEKQMGDLKGNTIQWAATNEPVPYKEGSEIGWCGRAMWQWPGRDVLPSIFMPRWASRINLEITGVRIERLQEIKEDDAISEGIERLDGPSDWHWCWKDYTGNGQKLSPVFSFISLWDSINIKRGYGWDTNPFVWKIQFKKI